MEGEWRNLGIRIHFKRDKETAHVIAIPNFQPHPLSPLGALPSSSRSCPRCSATTQDLSTIGLWGQVDNDPDEHAAAGTLGCVRLDCAIAASPLYSAEGHRIGCNTPKQKRKGMSGTKGTQGVHLRRLLSGTLRSALSYSANLLAKQPSPHARHLLAHTSLAHAPENSLCPHSPKSLKCAQSTMERAHFSSERALQTSRGGSSLIAVGIVGCSRPPCSRIVPHMETPTCRSVAVSI